MRPSTSLCSKASRFQLSSKHGNKDYYKGPSSSPLPPTRSVGASTSRGPTPSIAHRFPSPLTAGSRPSRFARPPPVAPGWHRLSDGPARSLQDAPLDLHDR